MHQMRWALATLSTIALLGACGSSSDEPPAPGSIVVTVTLSRSGAVGPRFDRVPQRGEEVTAADDAQRTWSGETDKAGQATVSLPAGEYDVEVPMCPDAPHHVTVTSGDTTATRFDCLAP